MSQITCDSCYSILANKYSYKIHRETNKACLALRNKELKTEFKCIGCDHYLVDNIRLKNHHESCKSYQIYMISEKIINEFNIKICTIHMDYKQQIDSIHIDYKKQIDSIHIDYKQQLKDKEHQTQLREKENDLRNTKEMYEKMIEKIASTNELHNEQLKDIASEAINKPTTTTNHVHGNIRNIFSSEYTVDNINQNEVKTKCQAYLTEEVFFQGQKGIAHLCNEHIVKTKDKKQLLTCTDTSRKKFKHMDENGNIKEDAEARTFLQKVAKPIKEVSRVVYDSIISDVEHEQEQLKQEEEMDYSRKSILSEKFIRAGSCLMEISNMDDVNLNKEFTSELAILTK